MHRALQLTLLVLGVLAIVAGLATVILGVDSVVGGNWADASIESELRFYAAWFVFAGAIAVWSSRRIREAAAIIRMLAGAIMLGGAGRLIGIATGEDPHWVQVSLMAAEFVIPLALFLMLPRALRV